MADRAKRESALPAISGAELGVQAWVGRERPVPEKFVAVTPSDHPSQKPRRQGFWTSTWHPEHGSGWVQWCLSEEYGCDRSDPSFPIWTLTPEDDARVYEIAGYSDLDALVAAYPHELHYPGSAWSDLRPDWAAIAVDFDAVHLTDEGQWATRLSMPLDLYGWDCESTLWLRWAFVSATDLGPVRCEALDPFWDEATA